MDTLTNVLAERLARYAHRPAVADPDGGWTYAELDAHATALARGLAGAGVRGGDRIIAVLPDDRHTVALVHAAIRSGVTIVPIEAQVTAYRLRWLIADAAPVMLVSGAERRDELAALSGVPVTTTADLARHPGDATGGGDGVAFLMYTSGTTAQPRGVICPADRVLFAATSIADRLAYRSDDVVLNRPPLSFDYGLYQVLLAALAGAQLVLPGSVADVRLLGFVAEVGATVLPLVPSMATLLNQLHRRRPTGTSVRLVTNTGAALTAPVVEPLRATLPGASIVFMYGMTECKRISVSIPDDDRAFPGSVGTAIPGTAVTVVDDSGRSLPSGAVGQFVAAGPHVMAGYWNDTDGSAGRFTVTDDGGPALRTGDYGHLDATGRLYFTGRRDDIFKRRGLRVSTHEVEAAALDTPGIETAAAIPFPDGRLVVWFTGDGTEQATLAGIAARIGPARTPDRAIRLEAMPHSTNGKIDRSVLRASEVPS